MLDPLLLRTFLVIAQGHSFSEASRRLAMRQSTVSDHVKRLEACLGRQLFVRDTHSVTLTLEGEALIGFAQSILEATERAERYFAGVKLRGRLRFGVSEDLVLSWLAPVLQAFMREHPEIDLVCTVALSGTLMSRFDAGELDVVLCKRWPGDERGTIVWTDEVVWVQSRDNPPVNLNPRPLVLYPPPAMTRSMALDALNHAQIPWRLVCTSDTLTGLVAGIRAGLGLGVVAGRLLPEGLVTADPALDLPPLGKLDFVLLRATKGPRAAIGELCASISAEAARTMRQGGARRESARVPELVPVG